MPEVVQHDAEVELVDWPAWVRAHEVCYEILPHHEFRRHAMLQVGYDVVLCARHPDIGHEEPGCEECLRVYTGLRRLLETVLPASGPSTRMDFRPFDASFHLRPETEWAPEIMLTVEIVHRGAQLVPVDAEEHGLAREIEKKLRQMGLRERTWKRG